MNIARARIGRGVFWSIHCHAAASLAAGIAHAPTGVIHCSCILVNSLPWSSSSRGHCHCNVATRSSGTASCISTSSSSSFSSSSCYSLQTTSSTSCSSDISQPSSFDGSTTRERQRARRTVSASRDSPHPLPLTQWAPSGWLLVPVSLSLTEMAAKFEPVTTLIKSHNLTSLVSVPHSFIQISIPPTAYILKASDWKIANYS